MKTEFRIQNSEFRIQNIKFGLRSVFICCLLSAVFFALSCSSIPNLEPPECVDSRGVVKEFYSFHIGNEMKFSQENLKLREKFFTSEYFQSLQNVQTDGDVFTTKNTDFPKAFRIGKCEVVAPDKTNVEVILFWKDDTRSEQREIKAETVKQNDKWLINKILN